MKNYRIKWKNVVRPYLSPAIKVLPPFVRIMLTKPSPIESTVKRLRVVGDAFNSPRNNKVKNAITHLKALSLNLTPLPEVFSEDFLSFLVAPRSCPQLDLSNIIEKAECLSIDLLVDDDWISLYRMCCIRGLYELGYIFREKAVDRTLSQGEPAGRGYLSKRYLSACLERLSVSEDQLEDLVNMADLELEDRQRFFEVSRILGFAESEKYDAVLDLDYRNYLKGKTIALVGPSESLHEDASEIDNHDEVVRLNFTHDKKGCDEIFNGNKTTITYFNGEQVSAFQNQTDTKLPVGLGYACLKNKESIERILESNPEVSCRQAVSFDGVVYNGSLNMGPIAVLDLAAHGSSKISIYHMDLMLTVKRFGGYYPEAFGRNSDAQLVRTFNRSTVVHDPVTQYRVFERLFQSGKIVGDKRFEEVMGLGCEEYMKQLQRSYSSLA